MFIVKLVFDNKIEKKFYLNNENYVEDILHLFVDPNLRDKVESLILEGMKYLSSNGDKEKTYKFSHEDIYVLIKIKKGEVHNSNVEYKGKLSVEDRKHLENRVLISVLRNAIEF